ncbi:regulatory protein RecX [Porphyromonas sp.]|uniref:regulatory protein RecX n=1 Tax=Porphyromonas sp. TaxID=1924944 RepID=UPI0026DB61E1|nr:regulatory protein RecX [Porphyromonas sp.]MDO4695676.1 regulatory protein RecX [Porphyromonas sp.]MDO4771500.1 regulatory protein RecX [Porphyromonas sp.]
MDEKELKRLISKAESYCVKGEKSPLEVIYKLRDWSGGEIDQQSINLIIARLTEDRYLDVERYVSAFVSDKVRFSKHGPVKIRFALREKGIEDRVIDEAISRVSSETWLELLSDFLRKKLSSVKSENPYQLRDKLFRAAYSRGFTTDLINRALSSLDDIDGLD